MTLTCLLTCLETLVETKYLDNFSVVIQKPVVQLGDTVNGLYLDKYKPHSYSQLEYTFVYDHTVTNGTKPNQQTAFKSSQCFSPSMVQTGVGFRNSAISSVLATCTFSFCHLYNHLLVHKTVMAGALLYVSY